MKNSGIEWIGEIPEDWEVSKIGQLYEERKTKVSFSCAIGDDEIDGLPYWKIVKIAKEYIDSVGGFEKFAEWGLI